MNDNAYNGWANKETWLVYTWIGSTQHLAEQVDEIARQRCVEWANEPDDPEGVPDPIPTLTEPNRKRAAHYAANDLRRLFEEARPDLYGVWADMMEAAFAKVDWLTIARHFVDDVLEDGDQEAFARHLPL